ncbi:hypothetical protein NCPPB3778_66 [Rathayibacter phage NCPPB3778]|nr:hypothetical protein NCPPB3778_66 [Rathayibacter phage NCPPB3778]
MPGDLSDTEYTAAYWAQCEIDRLNLPDGSPLLAALRSIIER